MGEDSNQETSSSDTKSAGALILDFPSLQNPGKFLLLNHPVYGISIYHSHSERLEHIRAPWIEDRCVPFVHLERALGTVSMNIYVISFDTTNMSNREE